MTQFSQPFERRAGLFFGAPEHPSGRRLEDGLDRALGNPTGIPEIGEGPAFGVGAVVVDLGDEQIVTTPRDIELEVRSSTL